MKLKQLLFWVTLTAVIFLTRFYLLVKYPPNLTIDEVSIGYNAYSILRTGKDEWGQFLPTSFRSVGDYKPPVLIYLTVPFVKFFGLTELTTRLPVAILSAITIILFFILLKRYLLKDKYQLIAYLATIFLSLSPWHIVYSRSGFEAILALCFLILNIIFIYEYRKSHQLIHFLLLVLMAYLSAITYHSTKLLVPIINIFVLWQGRDQFIKDLGIWGKDKKSFYLSISLILLITIFFIKNYIFGPGAQRAKMTFLAQDFDYARVLLPPLLNQPLSSISQIFVLVSFWFNRYLDYFSLNFYLSTGLNLTITGQFGQGVIYLVELPMLIIGFLALLLSKTKDNLFKDSSFSRTLLFFWLFLGFFPASLTNNSQHSLRSLNVIPVIYFLIALGFYTIYKFIAPKSSLCVKFFVAVYVAGLIFGVVRFVDYFTLHYPIELSEYRQQGWMEMANFAKNHFREYDTVYVDHRFGSAGPYTYGVPHLYFLFSSAYDPATYNSDPRRYQFNSDYENFKFVTINWPDIDHTKHNLYIASPWSFPKELLDSNKLKFKTNFLNGTVGLYAISD